MRPTVFLATLALAVGASASQPGQPTTLRVAQGVMCFKTGEESPPGFTKICYYDCLGSRVAITISSTSLCPLTIQR